MNLASLLGVLSKFNGGGKGGWGKGKGKGGKGGGRGDDATWNKLKSVSSDCKVWVGSLPKNVTWKELEKHFEETSGTKPSISHVAPNGTGVCAYKNADDAVAAIGSVNGTDLKGATIEVDVWTQMPKSAGGNATLVNKIKEGQRTNIDFKNKWWAFTDEHHGGVRDPKKHDASVLEEFLAANPFEGGTDKFSLVDKIKTLQRSDADAKAKWWAFTDEHHGGVHDPKKHDVAVLQEFLDSL